MNVLWFCVIFQYLTLTCCNFNFDELTNTNYGMEILETPVVMSEETGQLSDNSFQMTSVHGQHYQCSHPEIIPNNKAREEEQVAMETGVPELLRPMAEGPCLMETKGWWTYEFCFGQDIKQYHMQDGKVSGVVTSLGKFASEFNWQDEEEVIEKRKRKLLSRYHSQQYVNGSICDLTDKPRETEVRFHCEEGHGDYIHRIDEPQTCRYILSVHTTKICHHPYLKPPTPRVPVPLTCQPLLSEQEYQMYREEEERRQIEKNKYLEPQNRKPIEFTKSSQDEYTLRDGQLVPIATGRDNDWAEVDENEVTETLQDLDKAFSEALTKSMQEIFGDQVQHNGQMKMRFKVVDDDTDVAEVIRKYRTQNGKEQRNQLEGDPEEEGLDDDDDDDFEEDDFEDEEDDFEDDFDDFYEVDDFHDDYGELDDYDHDDYEDDFEGDYEEEDIENEGFVENEQQSGEGEAMENEDQEFLDEFDENLEEIAAEGKDLSRVAKHSSKIRDQMSENFDSIIKEAKEELGDEAPADVDADQLTQKLAKTLSSLLERLEKAEKDLDEADSNLKNALDSKEVKDTEGEEDDDWLDDAETKTIPSATPESSPSPKIRNLQSSRGKFARPVGRKPNGIEQVEKQPSAKVLTDLYHRKTSDLMAQKSDKMLPSEKTNNNDENGENGSNDEESRGSSLVGVDKNDVRDKEEITADNHGDSDGGSKLSPNSQNEKTFDGQTISGDNERSSLEGEEKISANDKVLSNQEISVDSVAEKTTGKQKPLETGDDKGEISDTSLNEDPEAGTSENQKVMEKSSTGSEVKTSVMTKDKKVEVKIVHAAYYDENDGTIHILPDDESQLGNIMMAVFGDNRDQWKEEERQEQLEKGYNFKFGSRNSKKKEKNQVLR